MAKRKIEQNVHTFFDTYIHVNELKNAGFNEKQAAVIIKSLIDSRGDSDLSHLATNEQVQKLELQVHATNEQVQKLEQSTTAQINNLDKKIEIYFSKLETKIAETHASTLRWMIGTMVAFSGIVFAGIQLLKLKI